MTDIDVFLQQPVTVLRRYHRGPRKAFSLPADRYGGWAILAPGDSGFETAVNSTSSPPSAWDWVAAGEVVFCPPGRYLHRRMTGPVTFHFLEISWINAQDRGFDGTAARFSGRIAPEEPWRILSSLSLLAHLESAGGSGSQRYSEHIVRDILYQCVWTVLGAQNRTAGDPRIASVDRSLRARFMEPLQLSTLASEVAMTPSQLTRRFRHAFGVTPLRRLTQIRLQEAARLLTSGDATLDQIAEACGYANGFYLSRVFTRHMGVPPSVYRRDHSV